MCVCVNEYVYLHLCVRVRFYAYARAVCVYVPSCTLTYACAHVHFLRHQMLVNAKALDETQAIVQYLNDELQDVLNELGDRRDAAPPE